MSAKQRVRRAVFILSFSILASFWGSPSYAQQRVYARTEPNVGDPAEKLVFDVNIDSSDNISPNIVLTADAKQGFVAYAGSGTVMSFDLSNGYILSRIKTGGKPQMATLLPDRRTILVVSVLDSKIFKIDMSTAKLVATFSFDKALFGFGSPIAVSPDGQTGYISSTGTGELIKFSTSDGKEIARLKSLEGPGNITVSIDGSVLMLVDTIKEELSFIDPASMTVKTVIKAKDKIVGADFTIFSKPVLSPDGTTGIICSQTAGLLSSGNFFYFKVATGELVDTGSVGSQPGFTGLTPDGKSWYVLNELSLTRIPVDDIKSAKEISTISGTPLRSANIVFSPDSRYAYYTSTEGNYVIQHDLVLNAVVGKIRVGAADQATLEQPSSLAITPDGKAVAVLEFVSNNIEILAAAYVLEGAKFISSSTKYSSVSVVNPTSDTITATIIALDIYGQIYSDTNVINPVSVQIPPKNQFSRTLDALFSLDVTKEVLGWIAVYSDAPGLVGYISIGNTDLTALDGVPLFAGDRMFDWIVPEVVRKEGNYAELNYMNPLYSQASYDATYYGADGTVLGSTVGGIAYPTNRQAQIFGDQYLTPEVATNGYLRVTSPEGILFTEYFGTDRATGALNGINMASFAGVTRLYSPQFAVVPGFNTILNVINGSGAAADITITLHAPDGSVIGQPLTVTLVKDAQLKDDLVNIFANDPAVANVAGWLEISSTKDKVVGTVKFTNENGDFLTAFQLQGTPSGNILFPVVSQDGTFTTGLALLNQNPDKASVTIEVWNWDGGLDQTTSVTLNPGQRTALYLSDYFPYMAPHTSGYIRVRSDTPLFGFALIHNQNLGFISAVPPIPLP